jgi:hypothetical protein
VVRFCVRKVERGSLGWAEPKPQRIEGARSGWSYRSSGAIAVVIAAAIDRFDPKHPKYLLGRRAKNE